MITYRNLQPAEWERLRPIYESQGGELPPAGQNAAAIAEADGAVIGMCGVNAVVHCGPLWVDPKWRGQGIADRLVAEADRYIRGLGANAYLMFPSNKGSIAVAERLGLELMTDCVIYQRNFKCPSR